MAGTSGEVRAASTTPIAPRGGVMMVPLDRESEDAPWPQRLPLVVQGGGEVGGKVIWMHARPGPGDADATSWAGWWTADPRGLAARAVEPHDRTSEGGRAFLLARLPTDGSGPITLDGQVIEPIWHDLPTRALHHARELPALPRAPGLDRPDPDSPFEHWRWVLLADRLDAAPPDMSAFDPAAALLAQHLTDLWQIGLARLEVESHGLAQHVRELLTRLCRDDDVAFAAWVADPGQTDVLLSTLLNTRRRGEALIDDVLAWLDEHERVRLWVESDARDRVRLVIVNPGFRPVIVRFNWMGIDEPPLAVEVQAGAMRRVTIDRPHRAMAGRRPLDQLVRGQERASHEVLQVESADRTWAISFSAGALVVQPPGLWLPVLRPPLSLAEVQGGRPPLVAAEQSAVAQVRRLRERWEVFVEVRRPQIRRGPDEEQRGSPTSIDAARGREAIVVTIGETRAVLIIPERGWHHLARGANDGSLQIYRQSYDDRWTCRIVLPDAWLNTLPGEYTQIAVMRTRQGSPGIDSSPLPTVPWRTEPGGMALDLSEWRDYPLVGP